MLKKIFFGIIWFVVIYFGICFIVGGIAGFVAGAENPENASQAGAAAGAAAVQKYLLFIFLGSIGAVIAGTVTEVLPGTKSKAVVEPKE